MAEGFSIGWNQFSWNSVKAIQSQKVRFCWIESCFLFVDSHISSQISDHSVWAQSRIANKAVARAKQPTNQPAM